MTSPGNGVLAIAPLPKVAHDNCSPTSNCGVSVADYRITSVVLQAGNDGNHYLLTSFHTGDRANNTVQALWFMGKVESFSNATQRWNGWYVDGPGWYGAYPTITMDDHMDLAFTFTTFSLGSTIYPNWYVSKGFIPFDNSFAENPPGLGYGILNSANSSGSYSPSCDLNSPPQRWGDYMSTLWDPNLSSTQKGFWTVQEYTTGGSNQSTQWAPLVADSLPYFVGYSSKESECGNGQGIGNYCSVTINAPTGVQNGDVLLLHVYMGQNATNPGGFSPVNWTLVSAPTGYTNPIKTFDSAGGGATSWLYAYIYGSQTGDTGSYTFTHFNNGEYINGVLYPAELSAQMAVYRQANQNLSQYLAYGFPGNQDSNSFSWGPISSPPAESTLATIISSPDTETDEEPGNGVNLKTLSGDPPLTLLTPLLSGIDDGFIADVPITSSGTSAGPYSASTNASVNGCAGCTWAVWQVAVPE